MGDRVWRPLPRWALALAAVIVVLLLLLLPSLFYGRPGFTLVVRGAPPDRRVLVDDVLRGIPGIEQAGDQPAVLIRVHGLKSGVTHTVRVDCGSEARLYLDQGSSTDTVSARDGEVVNLTVKNCESSSIPTEIDYHGPMRLVASGPFLMGDDQGPPNERPAHVVNLDYGYYIDQHEVTNQEYRAFTQGPQRRALPREPEWDPNYSAQPDYPVVGVSWDDAKAYCEQGVGKRLPTEAEWEKAASWDPRAGEPSLTWKRRWPWGKTFDPKLASFKTGHPSPAGQFAGGASAYGVLDLAGNLGEWVADSYRAYPGNSVPDPNYGGAFRVLRGGTFRTDDQEGLRTTRRSYCPPSFSRMQNTGASSYIGFRCAVRSDDPELQNHLKGTDRR